MTARSIPFVFPEASAIDKAARASRMGQRPLVIWLTGLSGAGKSTLARALDAALHNAGRHAYLIDGDNVRHGLNRDLGFDEASRAENIRRVGEVCRLMVDAGLIVIAAFISPFQRDRDLVRALFEPGEFIEVYLDASLQVCESRDPKGLYRKARRGDISQFTGIDSPYEVPDRPELVLKSGEMPAAQCLALLLAELARLGVPGLTAMPSASGGDGQQALE